MNPDLGEIICIRRAGGKTIVLFCFYRTTVDFRTALVGHFEDGLMKAAQVATLKTLIDDGGVKVPIFTEPQGPIYKRELAGYDHVTSEPLLPDPYETRLIKARIL